MFGKLTLKVCSYSAAGLVKQCALKNSNKKFIYFYGLRYLSSGGDSNQRIAAYVSHPYSYAFGRSDGELQYITIGDLLTKRAETDKNRTAIVSYHENKIKTFEEINADVNKLVNGLYTKLGLRRGDVIGVWSCNSYRWVKLQYACAKLGLILCTINPVYLAQELNYTLRKAQIKTLFMPGNESKQEIVNKFQNILAETLKLPDQGETDPLILKQVVIFDGQTPNQIKPGIDVYPFESLTLNDNIVLSEQETPTADDPAIIMFTSGTTGKPKGALLSHYTLVNNALLTAIKFGVSRDKQIVVCVPLPLFHSFAAVLGAISMSSVPSVLVLTGFKYDVKFIVSAMKEHGCTHIMATPTMIMDILNYVEKNDVKLPELLGAILGGASVPVELTHRIKKIIPSLTDVRIGYGATELGPCTTACHKDDSLVQRTETVGSPLDFVEVKIVNTQNGNITKIGEQGELLSRGHNVMIGYWRDEQKTKESIDDAKWYKSGDLAVMDELGFVKIIGRTKEMVIRGGENIYPREIEELLHTHPQVIDAYVIGVPDERMGEELCAWIKLRGGSEVTADQIKEFCKNKISYFKVPRYVLFVNDFPLTQTGKAKKYLMREQSCEILGLKEL